jgi:putative ABC transport system permease protein
MIDARRDDEVVISEAFSDANHLEPGDSLGAVINGRWKELRIAGVVLSPEYVYEAGSASVLPDNKRFGTLWIGRPALAAAYDMDGAFNDLTLTIDRSARLADVIDRLDLVLKPYGCLGAYGRADQFSNHFLQDEFGQLRTSALIIPMIFLGVAAFLLYIVLTRLVATQRDQIAVLKAFGYGNLTIGMHYAQFALAAILVGVIIGTGVGMWFGKSLTEVYTRYYKFPILRYVASPRMIGYTALIGLASAAIGAVGAVRRCVALPPAEAMRPETPARFKPGLLERLPLERVLSTGGRMILRNLERNRVKAALSVISIALSIAILITSYFSRDAIAYMIDVGFGTAEREDVTVFFNHPLPERALFDIQHLPGVIASEPYRMVPARIRYGHHVRRLALQGLAPGGDLRRIVDRRRRLVLPPDDGLMMTTTLARFLDVTPGDVVTVEILEGKQRTLRCRVTGVVEDLFGLSVYLTQSALNRMLEEGPMISAADITVDARQASTLYAVLKATPAVAGVSVRRGVFESFTKLMSEGQGTTRTVLVIFASMIAMGIVYNSARIALSERGRELASLRVFGFSNREVALLLLGEQALLTAVAIPVGFLMAYGICAAIAQALEGENYRIPLIISSETFALSAIAVVIAAAVSALLVRRRIYSLDIVEVLKTRE